MGYVAERIDLVVTDGAGSVKGDSDGAGVSRTLDRHGGGTVTERPGQERNIRKAEQTRCENDDEYAFGRALPSRNHIVIGTGSRKGHVGLRVDCVCCLGVVQQIGARWGANSGEGSECGVWKLSERRNHLQHLRNSCSCRGSGSRAPTTASDAPPRMTLASPSAPSWSSLESSYPAPPSVATRRPMP
jgi:hypothetical protein